MGSLVVEEAFDMLLVRLAQRDVSALEELYDQYSPTLFGIALRWTDQYGAEQVVERTFLTLWRQVAGWDRSKGGSFTYLLGIMIREARVLSIPVDRTTLITAFGLQNWAQHLCPADHTVFETIYSKGLSVAEASEVLGATTTEVEDRIGKVLHELLQHARS